MSSTFPKKGKLKQIYIQDESVKLSRLLCPWCGYILSQPQRLYCGHTICQQCLTDELENAQSRKDLMRCIKCNSQVEEEQIGQDRITACILDQIRVKCPAKKCIWEGLNKDYAYHYEHECKFTQRLLDARYEYTYYSNRAQFKTKLDDEQQLKCAKPNLLIPGMTNSLREKLQKQWMVQERFKDQEWKRRAKRLRGTF